MKIETLYEKVFSGRTQAQRWLILLGTILFPILFFYLIALSPMQNYQTQITKEIEIAKNTLQQLQAENTRFKLMSNLPVNAELTKKMKLLESDIAETVRPFITKRQIATPNETQNFLNELSKPMPDLYLENLDHKGEKIVITLHGGYLAAFSYLQYLDQLPWSFAFDEFHYAVTEYPNAVIIVGLHPLTEPAVFSQHALLQLNDPSKPLTWRNTLQKIPDNISLSGIFISKNSRHAIINGNSYSVGDKVENYEISQITQTEVYLKNNKGVLVIPVVSNFKSAPTEGNGTRS